MITAKHTIAWNGITQPGVQQPKGKRQRKVTTAWLIQYQKHIIVYLAQYQFRDTTDVFPCHIHLPVCVWTMDSGIRAPKKNTSHGNEVLLKDTTHLIQRPCYQRRIPFQDPSGNETARRPLDHRKEMQTEVVWTCLPFTRSGQNHFARHGERRK